MNTIYETRLERVAETGEHYRGLKIRSTADACDVIKRLLSQYFDSRCDIEEFFAITLDTKNTVTGVFRISRGTLDASLVHPREVFRPAIANAASSIILAHNHPSGDATPSKEDFAVTKRLRAAGETVGIDVLDHIVVGENSVQSIALHLGFK